MNEGFSIIELVISIVVVSICIIPISLLYQEAMRGSIETNVLTVANALAEGELEENLQLGFSGVSDVASTAFSEPFDDYSYQVTVHYVNASDLETSVDPTVTDYRTVEVQVSHDAIGTISSKSLLTNY